MWCQQNNNEHIYLTHLLSHYTHFIQCSQNEVVILKIQNNLGLSIKNNFIPDIEYTYSNSLVQFLIRTIAANYLKVRSKMFCPYHVLQKCTLELPVLTINTKIGEVVCAISPF